MYRTICTKLWTDAKVQALAPLDKLVFLYLITSPHSHLSGLYYLPRKFAEHEIGTKVRWSALQPLVDYDEANQQVWVKKMYGYQGRGPKIKKTVERHLLTLQPSPIVFEFAHFYGFSQVIRKLRVKDTPSIPHRYPIDGTPDTDTDTDPDSDPDSFLPISARNLSNGHDELALTPDEVVARWNARVELKPIKQVTGKLNERIAARLREHPDPSWWKALFDTVVASKFLTGRTDKPFFATLDWSLGPENLAKIQQGNYDDMPMPDGFESLRNWVAKSKEKSDDTRRIC